MKILAVGAHPDDVEIYMFATLAAFAASGAAVQIAIATDGAKGGKAPGEELAKRRKEEAIAAATLIGVTPHFLDFADGALVADASLVEALRRLVATVRPDLVITHAPNDYHGDHRALGQATSLAASFAAPVLWADTMMGAGFLPTHYVDATAHMELKLAAIRKHASQDPERFVETVLLQNRFRARQCNAGPDGFAEAFRFEPTYPFADIRSLLPPAPAIRPVANRAG